MPIILGYRFGLFVSKRWFEVFGDTGWLRVDRSLAIRSLQDSPALPNHNLGADNANCKMSIKPLTKIALDQAISSIITSKGGKP